MAELAPPCIVRPVVAGAVRIRIAGAAIPSATLTLRVYDATGSLVAEHFAPGATPEVDLDLGAPLTLGQQLAALQARDAVVSPEGPRIVVEAAPDPFWSTPSLLLAEVDCESRGVRVLGAIPGWAVEVVEPRRGTVVGAGAAGPDGRADVQVDLSSLACFSDTIAARQAGVAYPLGPASPLVLDNDMLEVPRSLWMPPCARLVQVVDARPGTTVRVKLLTRSAEATAIAYGTSVDVWMQDELADDDVYSIQESWDLVFGVPGYYRDSAYQKGSPSAERAPLAPPTLLGVYVGALTILVLDQFPGSIVVVTVTDVTGVVVASWERGGTIDPEFPLGVPLAEGDVVAASQVLCDGGLSSASDPVVATPTPQVVTPVVVAPLYAGGGAVTIAGTVAGGLVVVYSKGIVVGTLWATGNAAVVPVSPALLLGADVTARMTLNGAAGALSAPVTVGAAPDVLTLPRILQPVVAGDDLVCVTGVTPGARVQILDRADVVRGEVVASESLVRVPTSPLGLQRKLRPRVVLGGTQVDGPEVAPVEPVEVRDLKNVMEATFRLDGGSLVKLDPAIDAGPVVGYGQVYLPLLPDGSVRPPTGLVLIVHGVGDGPQILYPTVTADLSAERPPDGFGNPLGTAIEIPPSPNTSYLGYGWLAMQLAARGLHVYSIRVDRYDMPVPERQAIADAYLDRLREDATAVVFAQDPIAVLALTPNPTYYLNVPVLLVGHSNGGEAVYFMAEPGGRNIAGVLAMTPSRNEGPRRASVPILQVNGSDDHFFVDPVFWVTAWHLDDTSVRPRAFLWLPGAAHDDFSSEWYYERWQGLSDLSFDPGVERGRNTIEETQALTLPIALAFLLDRIGDSRWVGWLDGTVTPPSHRVGDARLRHWPAKGPVGGPEGVPFVIDDFAPENPDATVNALGLSVTWNLPDLAGIGLPSPKLLGDSDLRMVADPVDGGPVTDLSDSIHASDRFVAHLMWTAVQVGETTYATSVSGAWPSLFSEPYQLRIALTLLHSGDQGKPGAFSVDGLEIPVDSSAYNHLGQERDATVVLTDRAGRQARVRLGAIRPIPYPAQSEIANAASGIDAGGTEPEHLGFRMALQDWCIPLDAFQAVNPSLNLAEVELVSIEPLAEPMWVEIGLVEVDR